MPISLFLLFLSYAILGAFSLPTPPLSSIHFYPPPPPLFPPSLTSPYPSLSPFSTLPLPLFFPLL